MQQLAANLQKEKALEREEIAAQQEGIAADKEDMLAVQRDNSPRGREKARGKERNPTDI